jgi:hypothetical protein
MVHHYTPGPGDPPEQINVVAPLSWLSVHVDPELPGIQSGAPPFLSALVHSHLLLDSFEADYFPGN